MKDLALCATLALALVLGGQNLAEASDALTPEVNQQQNELVSLPPSEEPKEKAQVPAVPDSESNEGSIGKLFGPDKLGRAILGMLIGMGLGGISAEASMAASGGVPDPQNALSNIWAGAFGGALVAYRLDPETSIPEDADVSTRTHNALFNGFWTGLMGGVVGGSVIQLGSGSSKEDGISASSGSSSASSSDNQKNEFRGAGLEQLGPSGNVPLIHAMLAGAVGGAGVAYLEPEIHTFAETVGGAVLGAAGHLHSTAKQLHRRLAGLRRANICFARDEENPNEEVTAMHCEGGYMIHKIDPAPYSFSTESDKALIKEYLDTLKCEKQTECKFPQCGATDCPVPGCSYTDEEHTKVTQKFVTYECVEGTKKAEVCLADSDDSVDLACTDGLVLKDIRPDPETYDSPEHSDEAMAFITKLGCTGLTECALPHCDTESCPVPGCDAESGVQKYFLFDCANGPTRVQACVGPEGSSKQTVTIFESISKISHVEPDHRLELDVQDKLKSLVKHCEGKHECKIPRCEKDSCQVPGCGYVDRDGELSLSEVHLLFHTEDSD